MILKSGGLWLEHRLVNLVAECNHIISNAIFLIAKTYLLDCRYLYNGGDGKWIHCVHLACLRNRFYHKIASKIGFTTKLCENASEKGFTTKLCKNASEIGFTTKLYKVASEIGFSTNTCENTPEIGFTTKLCKNASEIGFTTKLFKNTPDIGFTS